MRIKYKDNGYILCFLLCFILSYLVLLKSDYFPADFLPYTEIYDGTYGEINNIPPVCLFIFNTVVSLFKFPLYIFCNVSLCLMFKLENKICKKNN